MVAKQVEPERLVFVDEMGGEHFPFCHACLVTYGRASILLCAPQPWEEHHLARQHLPAYSPDLNPIEEAFGKMKSILRKAQLRSREALIEAIGRALDAITPQDAQSFFRHCGYLSPGQPL